MSKTIVLSATLAAQSLGATPSSSRDDGIALNSLKALSSVEKISIPLLGGITEWSGPHFPLLGSNAPSKSQIPTFTGTFDTLYAVQEWDHASVKAMLPPKLELGNSAPARRGKHPVIIGFGLQSDVRAKNSEQAPIHYNEFFLLIPNVAHKDHPDQAFSFMPFLYLDKELPVRLGRNLYGYNKLLAQISVKGTKIRAGSLSISKKGESVFRASYRSRKITKPSEQKQLFQNYQQIAPLFSNPKYLGIHPKTGAFLVSEIRIKSRTTTFYDTELQGSLPERNLSSVGLSQSPFGAFRLVVDWVLSPPYPLSKPDKEPGK